jgi:hypothetical protein
VEVPTAVAPPTPVVFGGFLLGPARHMAVWSALTLLVTGVVAVGVWICVTFQTAVTPVLLALLARRCSGRSSGGWWRWGSTSPLPPG